MELTVAKICEVSFSHNYFKDGVVKNLFIEPTSTCWKLLSNYRMFFRNTGSGFLLLTSLDNSDSAKPFIHVNKNESLSFVISLNDPFFLNYTNLPADKNSGEIFYFSNLNDNIAGSKLLLSSNNSTEYVTEDDIVQIKSQKFTCSGTSANPTAHILVKDINGSAVIDEIVQVHDESFSLLIDLANLKPARYKLYIDGFLESDFYADSSLLNKNVFGILEIFISDSVAEDYMMFDEDKNVSAKKFVVQFDRRKTIWKYNVVMKYRMTIDPSGIEITHPDSSIEFSQLSVQTLSDGSIAVPFISNIEIDLTEETITGIELNATNGSTSNSVKIENLPNASVKYSSPDLSENKVYSEIYVYI